MVFPYVDGTSRPIFIAVPRNLTVWGSGVLRGWFQPTCHGSGSGYGFRESFVGFHVSIILKCVVVGSGEPPNQEPGVVIGFLSTKLSAVPETSFVNRKALRWLQDSTALDKLPEFRGRFSQFEFQFSWFDVHPFQSFHTHAAISRGKQGFNNESFSGSKVPWLDSSSVGLQQT